ncbi:Uncharacterised protein [Mycobacteroides abscessus subsp. massiliense]|nr:Uncharacterised protein [Mycobacteroides abscessus subsp. massiliense]SKH39018.1 Uncharacterised protein [Mycobacteroides abscessus subsp. massiliense]SKH89847.1 Uncharacterised protein [Mycobacteroides abscessus subsp. massiliense]SKK83598.1 Uncharacterised protein [Mycobacteroides abscessus subsp. massiliense]SKK90012.1 Uncharacterised protein [Mycobacteroides abscessus subsp. massiliense]
MNAYTTYVYVRADGTRIPKLYVSTSSKEYAMHLYRTKYSKFHPGGVDAVPEDDVWPLILADNGLSA